MTLGLLPANHEDESPRFKSELWCRDALLRMYDISAVLTSSGLKVDLLLFENRRTLQIPASPRDSAFERWIQENNQPRDWVGTWTISATELRIPGATYLSGAARSAGACFFSIDDLSLSEIGSICGDDEISAVDATKSTMDRLRVDQYFNPPTDELILTALSLTSKNDLKLVTDLYQGSMDLGHQPFPNTIVTGSNYLDPVQTAKGLAEIKAIDYEATVVLRHEGKEIVHRVSKSAQENFVIKVLRTIDIPGVTKAIIDGIRGVSQ